MKQFDYFILGSGTQMALAVFIGKTRLIDNAQL
jgi:pantothenate synthetase